MINKLLKELRDSADIQFEIFTEGSCFRLYKILKIIFPTTKAYWSDMDNHCVSLIDGEYYDIGGIIKKSYIETRNYNKIRNSEMRGYSLLKWIDKDSSIGSRVEKYKN
jgi:hypothetical protein